MIAAAPVLTQLFLSCAALLGLLVLYRALSAHDPFDPINRRFLFCVRVMILVFAGRALMVLTGIDAFRVLVLIGAALIPLAALVMTEGLLRRHAPWIVKAVIGVGTAIFIVTAFWYSSSIDPARLVGLFGFQLLGFTIAGWLILMRDKASLSVSENTMVVRLGLSLFLFIPLAASDYLPLLTHDPFQFSPLAVLILCWLAIGLGRGQTGHGSVLIGFGVMVAASVFTGSLIALLGQLGREGFVLCVALTMATVFLVAILNDAGALRAADRSQSLLRHLAGATTDDPLVFLNDLRNHPLVEGAVVVSDEALAELQAPVIAKIFAAAPVLRRAAPPPLGPVADDHIAYLFERYSATHFMFVAANPPVLIALSMPSLSASPAAEMELQVVQRMAMLMSQKEKNDG